MHLPQARSRLDAEALDERRPGVSVCIERLGLTALPIEGEHELGPWTFSVRVPGDQRLQLPEHLGLPPQCELGLDPLFHGVEAKIGQAVGLDAGECLVGELSERRASPELQCFAQALLREPRVSGRHRRRGLRPPGA